MTRANGTTTGTTDDLGCYEFVCSSLSTGTATGPSQVCAGATANLTASSVQATAVKWQQSSASNFSSPTDVNTGSGYETTSLTTAAINSTTYYRLAATCVGDYSDIVYSNVVTISNGVPTKYVATNGNDSNGGNSAGSGNAYLTLSHAISEVAVQVVVVTFTFSRDLHG